MPLRQRPQGLSACRRATASTIYLPMILGGGRSPCLRAARIGAGHSVGDLRWLLKPRRDSSDRLRTTPTPSSLITADARLPPRRTSVRRSSLNGGCSAAKPSPLQPSSTSLWSTGGGTDVTMADGTRPLVPRAHGRRLRPTARLEPMDAEQLLFPASTPRARPLGPRASCTPPGGYLTQVRPSPTSTPSTCDPDTDVYWCAADMSAGSPATATSSTDRSPTACTQCDVRGRPRYAPRAGPLG